MITLADRYAWQRSWAGPHRTQSVVDESTEPDFEPCLAVTVAGVGRSIGGACTSTDWRTCAVLLPITSLGDAAAAPSDKQSSGYVNCDRDPWMCLSNRGAGRTDTKEVLR